MNIYFIDLDGTLEDSKKDMSLCVNRTRNKLLLPELEITFIEQYVNKGMDELYRNCFSDFLESNPDKYNLVKSEYEDCYFKNVAVHTLCYEGIPKALENLSKKGKVVVVTNKPEKISRELLRKLKIDDYISDVMGGDSCSECKPSPLPLKIAAEKLNFNRQIDSAYMIGDSEGDIKTAQAFGARSVWCSWGYLKNYPTLKPDIVVNFPTELINL